MVALVSTRQARRLKQRQENTGRALKMHEAKLSDERLYAPHSVSEDRHPHVFIGCSGWFYWDWRGVFYPQDMPTSQWFGYYQKHFDTVELNAPFYSWPTVATVKSWVRQAKDKSFVYTVKVNELITHTKSFKGTKQLVKDFGYIADLLGPHMGCFLFQLPASYTYTPSRLKQILGQLEAGRRNVVEFRHSSWWNETVYRAFRAAGVIFCACSGPGLPEELVKTAEDVYIRFHGKEKWYRYNYSEEELADWATRIKQSSAKRLWIYFNNDYEGHAIHNAHALQKLLS